VTRPAGQRSTRARILILISGERPEKSALDKSEGHLFSYNRFYGGSIVACRTSRLESGHAAHHFCLVLLQILLFRILCNRTLCGPRLSVFRPMVLRAISDVKKTLALALASSSPLPAPCFNIPCSINVNFANFSAHEPD